MSGEADISTDAQAQEGQNPEEGGLAPNFYNFFDDEDFSALDQDDPAGESDDPEKTGDQPPTGEKESETPAPSGEEKPGEKEGEEKPGDVKPKGEEKPKEEKPKDEPAKPPPGYVPNQALQEERSKRQMLSQELYQAKQRLAELEGKEAPKGGDDEFKDFKVLSDKEVEELWDEDPKEAALYQNRLIRYQDHRRKQIDEKRSKQSLEAEQKQIVESAYAAMNSAVPELFDPKSDVNATLTKHAADQGLSAQMAAVLTDPQTVIQARDKDGSTKSFILGQGAAEVLSLIANTHKAISSTDVEAVKKQVAEETEKRVREEVTKELTEKFKNMSGGENDLIFQSLGDATPKSGDELGGSPNSEEDWFGLPEDARRKFLGG
jgi:hypothetical protein